jgi:hypothetical protein
MSIDMARISTLLAVSMKKVAFRKSKDDSAAQEESLSFSDRLWFLWSRYRRAILAISLFALCAAASYGATVAWNRCRFRAMQRQFLSALEYPEKLEKFARKYGAKPLGAFAHLILANGAHGADDFSGACDHYSKTGALHAAGWDQLVALAMAHEAHRLGEGKLAEDCISKLLSGANRPQSIVAGARYLQALMAMERGDADGVRAALDELDQIQSAGIWAARASTIALSLD